MALPIISELEFPKRLQTDIKNNSPVNSYVKIDYDKRKLTYKNGRIMFVYNDISEIGKLEPRKKALVSWIEKIIKTEKDSYSIYSKENDGIEGYGSDFYKYKGHAFPLDILKPLFAEEFRRCLKTSDEIVDVINMDVSISNFTTVITSGQVIRGKESFYTSKGV